MTRTIALTLLLLLTVPHVPQFGDGAQLSGLDCGAAAAAALIRAHHPEDTTTVDQLYSQANTDGQPGLVFYGEIAPLLEKHGVEIMLWRNVTQQRQTDFIAAGRPYITAIKPGQWWHTVTVIGWDETTVYYHDPARATGPSAAPAQTFLQWQGRYNWLLVPLYPIPQVD